MSSTRTYRVITDTNIQEFFRESVDAAVAEQQIEADAHTVCYVVNLLTSFARSENLFEHTASGVEIKPLAMMYADALECESDKIRDSLLRRLGDIALYISGFFSESLARKPIDVDYYVAMGGNAYGVLADRAAPGHAFATVFEELSTRFADFVDVLGAVSGQAMQYSDRDILRLYEIWLLTGSRRVHGILNRLGIQPAPAAAPRFVQ